jgi:hypothetical protein
MPIIDASAQVCIDLFGSPSCGYSDKRLVKSYVCTSKNLHLFSNFNNYYLIIFRRKTLRFIRSITARFVHDEHGNKQILWTISIKKSIKLISYLNIKFSLNFWKIKLYEMV